MKICVYFYVIFGNILIFLDVLFIKIKINIPWEMRLILLLGLSIIIALHNMCNLIVMLKKIKVLLKCILKSHI